LIEKEFRKTYIKLNEQRELSIKKVSKYKSELLTLQKRTKNNDRRIILLQTIHEILRVFATSVIREMGHMNANLRAILQQNTTIDATFDRKEIEDPFSNLNIAGLYQNIIRKYRNSNMHTFRKTLHDIMSVTSTQDSTGDRTLSKTAVLCQKLQVLYNDWTQRDLSKHLTIDYLLSTILIEKAPSDRSRLLIDEMDRYDKKWEECQSDGQTREEYEAEYGTLFYTLKKENDRIDLGSNLTETQQPARSRADETYIADLVNRAVEQSQTDRAVNAMYAARGQDPPPADLPKTKEQSGKLYHLFDANRQLYYSDGTATVANFQGYTDMVPDSRGVWTMRFTPRNKKEKERQ
jgi:hypothetical protein